MIQERRSVGNQLVLENCLGYYSLLSTVLTNRKNKINRKEFEKDIRIHLEPDLDKIKRIKDKPLDLAIVVKKYPKAMKYQDVDNMAKLILDALKRDKKNPDFPFLFEDDKQIMSLLVWKLNVNRIKGITHKIFNIESLDISFRVHNKKRQMILKELDTI